MGFLTKQNLPGKKAALCAIAKGFPEIKKALETLGITVLETAPHKRLQNPVSAHADMQLHDAGGGKVFAASGAYPLITQLESLGFTVEEEAVSPEYPGDTALNCFLLGKYLYCNPKGIGKNLLNYYHSIGIEIASVKQGYTKCSTCIVDSNSIITADASITAAALAHGADVLKIQNGNILLPGFDYGFIGGTSGLIDKDKLAFTGTLSGHPDESRMKAFCAARGVMTVELTSSRLIDIGGILPLVI